MDKISYLSVDDLDADQLVGGSTLLIRHAERYPLNKQEDIIAADLTPAGFEAAYRFGQKLAEHWRIGLVYSSPIQRCINTGRSILEGAGQNNPIQLKWWLFSPFLESSNGHGPDAASIRIERKKLVSVVDKQKLAMVLDRIKYPIDPDVINLYLAHDTTILPLLAYIQGIELVNMTQIPNYLEGIGLSRGNGNVALLGWEQ